MEFVIQTEMEPSESDHLFKWSDNVFPSEGRHFQWAMPTHHIIAKDLGRAIAHVGFGKFLVVGGDVEKPVIGVGGVVVRPEYQGRDIPQKMFEILNTTSALNARNRVKTLFCPDRLVSYYVRHGYKKFGHRFKFRQEQVFTETDKLRFMVRGELGFSCDMSIPSHPW